MKRKVQQLFSFTPANKRETASETKLSAAEKPVSKLCGFARSLGTTVEFNAIHTGMVEDVPTDLKATNSARVKMGRQIFAAYAAGKKSGGDNSSITLELPWNMLDFPAGIGRAKHCNLNNVANIVGNFVDSMYAIPRVAALPIYDDNSRLISVMFIVGDGWHRRTAKLELYYSKNPDGLRQVTSDVFALQCEITPVTSMAEVAMMFSAKNSTKYAKPVKGADDWRPRVVAGDKDPQAQAVVRLAAKYGFDATSPANNREWPCFTSGFAMEQAMFELSHIGVDAVERTLKLLSNKELIGVHGWKQALSSQIFGGLCHFVSVFERNGFAHAAGLEHIMRLENFCRKIMDAAGDLSDADIKKIIPECASLGRNENKRYLLHSASIAEVYKYYVPGPKVHRKVLWPECPAELRVLMHDAPKISNPLARNNFIADLQTKLAAKNCDGYLPWRQRHVKSITR